MQVKELKIKFQEELKEEYPQEEIVSFFNLLAEEYLGMNRLQMAIQPEREISKAENANFEAAFQKLKNHYPVQYILGETEFFGLIFQVNEAVLIPRPETEELVQWILEDHSSAENLKILDIGTGSGCIAIALAKHLKNAEVFAIDVSKKALETASINAENNDVKITFMEKNVLEINKLDQHFDIIVSNPPYVRELEKKQMQRNVLDFEPELALYVGDENPLVFYKTITKLAENSLRPSGKLYFEINQYLAEETGNLLKMHNFKPCLKKDIFGNYRMLKGTF
ncbi:peptide chain release factor N(5)-glutamine methyltransferase [Zunongwangia sp. F363]|uniref:Release factor glutamine methyltransferase n=1 Tax=Autumnicola tepida TaxID=3075595 RepID=A0ABU3CDN4_9FLAO|nr:peptide chain release factor N(5)-glutamine methyltransferase [Zunongwangia sp. F363]MDT0644368.1 peptide chain release factor N(5)-glutamine methyltransferase [Zunongwangia sp. F363]